MDDMAAVIMRVLVFLFRNMKSKEFHKKALSKLVLGKNIE